MAVLWTDVITPAELTGYARESLAAYEARQGTLARWLPNREVNDVAVRFVAGQSGLVEEARYRAYDAEPEIGAPQPGRRVSIELPAVSQEIPVSEYQQLRERNAGDQAILSAVLRTTDSVVRAIADRVERTRGVVLNTGKATINQSNFVSDDDFGRDPALTVTAGTLWSAADADPLEYLTTLFDLYVSKAGQEPGAMLMGNRVLRQFAGSPGMVTQLANGASRPATFEQAQQTITGHGLPEITRYNRRTKSGLVLPDDRVLFLPAPVDVNDAEGTELGATFWGQTLTASDSDFGLEATEDMAGIVAGVWRNQKPPMIAEVIGDSISLPVLANANLSLSAKVL
ncbi:major capsid protein [Auraticoccus monumenti]|uniref:Phage major capsid protein E n=1 Tax=Auraticoccus monumenti TaxID=675864 RepID=A0A1G6UIZ8_9ACTN|nr:major capsid protein [Auraticoccus monumenti]SDD41229.1 Phage major capsid protein E [Auraticoccus monumenti]